MVNARARAGTKRASANTIAPRLRRMASPPLWRDWPYRAGRPHPQIRRRRSVRTLGGLPTTGAPHHRLADARRSERVRFCPRSWSRGEAGVVARVKARVAWSGRGVISHGSIRIAMIFRNHPSRSEASSRPAEDERTRDRIRQVPGRPGTRTTDPSAIQARAGRHLNTPSVCRAQMASGSDPRPSRVERSGPRVRETRSPYCTLSFRVRGRCRAIGRSLDSDFGKSLIDHQGNT